MQGWKKKYYEEYWGQKLNEPAEEAAPEPVARFSFAQQRIDAGLPPEPEIERKPVVVPPLLVEPVKTQKKKKCAEPRRGFRCLGSY